MRAADCPCGEHLTGRNDTEVLEALKRHNTEDHQDEYSESQLRVMVNTTAYDERAE